MNLKKHNVGDHRWHISVYFELWKEKEEFSEWMKENLPECFCVYRDDGITLRHFEVRGRDVGQMMIIFLRWG